MWVGFNANSTPIYNKYVSVRCHAHLFYFPIDQYALNASELFFSFCSWWTTIYRTKFSAILIVFFWQTQPHLCNTKSLCTCSMCIYICRFMSLCVMNISTTRTCVFMHMSALYVCLSLCIYLCVFVCFYVFCTHFPSQLLFPFTYSDLKYRICCIHEFLIGLFWARV